MKADELKDIMNKKFLDRNDLIYLLECTGQEMEMLLEHGARVRNEYAGPSVYFRGLIELSNICRKNCLYCGIRSGHKDLERYSLTDEEVLQAVRYAMEHNYASIVLQSGEMTSRGFTRRIQKLLNDISRLSEGSLRITLSCGEQSRDTYKRWFESGANRYLLRIETSNPVLYEKMHPQDGKHLFRQRMECLEHIKETGYQTGTGVMIGLPFQSTADLADDLLFMKHFDIDMVGMGPYLEHPSTPLYKYRHLLPSSKERLEKSLKMIALLRILMKDINIASTTALEAIDPMGREKGLMCGANVVMPNITPGIYRPYYLLYEGKPCPVSGEESGSAIHPHMTLNIKGEDRIAWGEWGDSKHYHNRYTPNSNRSI